MAKSEHFSHRLDSEDAAKLKELAHQLDRPVSSIIRLLIRRAGLELAPEIILQKQEKGGSTLVAG